jgi:hypothetical protein
LTRFLRRDQEDGSKNLEGRSKGEPDRPAGDPLYLKRANSLFYEFRRPGFAQELGYDSPADVVEKYPDFYWSSVAPLSTLHQIPERHGFRPAVLANLHSTTSAAIRR